MDICSVPLNFRSGGDTQSRGLPTAPVWGSRHGHSVPGVDSMKLGPCVQ